MEVKNATGKYIRKKIGIRDNVRFFTENILETNLNATILFESFYDFLRNENHFVNALS